MAIMTVRGPIADEDLGFTLPHEHIIVDFGGAEGAGAHRYKRDEVVNVMTPFLEEARGLGITGFIDCTPMYLARDPRILAELSEKTGLHIVTNTGQYKEPYLPKRTFETSAEELAAEWIAEWRDGIDGTDVRPGFVKTAVFPDPLAPVQRKIIEAAALTSVATGLAIGTHTCRGIPALQILRILDAKGVDPAQWIFIHAHQEPDYRLIASVAREGAWIELDGIGAAPDPATLATLLALLDDGYADRVLLSHDAGWYTVGEPRGGNPRGYTHLVREFLPLARSVGIDDETIRLLTVTNPARAFSYRRFGERGE